MRARSDVFQREASLSVLLRPDPDFSPFFFFFFSFFLNPRYHDCYINGAKVSDMMLGRYTTFEIRVNYDTLDVSSLLHPGQANTIACGVGNGW